MQRVRLEARIIRKIIPYLMLRFMLKVNRLNVSIRLIRLLNTVNSSSEIPT